MDTKVRVHRASLHTYVRASMFVTVCVYICACHACVCVFARVGMYAYVRAYEEEEEICLFNIVCSYTNSAK